MIPKTPLSKLADENVESLRARWQATSRVHRERWSLLLDRVPMVDQACALLVRLARIGSAGEEAHQSDEEKFKTVLQDLNRLQVEHALTAQDMVAVLLVMRDVLSSAMGPVRDGPESAPTAMERLHGSRLSKLLNRLGMMFFEGSMHEGQEQPDPEALEYALLYEWARQMAITDSLTGLRNFGYFRDRLREERTRADRYQHLLSLIILDIDHFKHYNDKNGHPAGNEVLKTIANVLSVEARETDLVARYGGEEFVVLLPETSRKLAWEVAERIRTRIGATAFANGDAQPLGSVTISAGVATFPVDAIREDELVGRADESLYEAKSRGRNRVVAYEPPNKVTISYRPEEWVTDVALVGSFNNWDKDADPMMRDVEGNFSFIMSLNPGVYRYKFVLNGSVWTTDPTNQKSQPDNMGGANSLLEVTE